MKIGDSSGMEITVAQKDSSLLFYHAKWDFIEKHNISFLVSHAHAEPRTLRTSDSEDAVEIRVANRLPMQIGQRRKTEYLDHIAHRVQENEIIRNSGDYGVFKQGDRSDSLSYLRGKICNISSFCRDCKMYSVAPGSPFLRRCTIPAE